MQTWADNWFSFLKQRHIQVRCKISTDDPEHCEATYRKSLLSRTKPKFSYSLRAGLLVISVSNTTSSASSVAMARIALCTKFDPEGNEAQVKNNNLLKNSRTSSTLETHLIRQGILSTNFVSCLLNSNLNGNKNNAQLPCSHVPLSTHQFFFCETCDRRQALQCSPGPWLSCARPAYRRWPPPPLRLRQPGAHRGLRAEVLSKGPAYAVWYLCKTNETNSILSSSI